MRSKQKLALLIICILALRLKADIRLFPGSEPLRQMFDEATLVCRCSVLNVKVLREEKIPGDPHGYTFNVMKALLKEEKLYKADHKGYQTITLIYEEYPFSPDIALERVESDRLFFLKRKMVTMGLWSHVITFGCRLVRPWKEPELHSLKPI